MSAKWMTKELFHGRNHPKYQEIEIYETFIRRILPDVMKQFFEQFCSLSKSGNKSKGQGLDFLLEEENKNVKGWLKRGVPSDESWLATCRNHQSLKSLKKNVLAQAGVESLECNDRELKIESAIKEWRCHLRESKYIESDCHGPVLTSLSGHVLCQELVNFTSEANRKRSYRILDMILHQTPPNDPTLHHPVYITVDERDKFSADSALSVQEIDNKILDIIELLHENSKKDFMKLFDRLIKVKSNLKEQHLIFLEEVSQAVAQQLPTINEEHVPFHNEPDMEQD
ncbi:uncharacterized protein LOC133176524 [Saccostrea echinata]|nr:uncharacterized protein LOC133176524 [Saccostrea echinata]